MATLKELLQTAIDTRVGQALPKGASVTIAYTPFAYGGSVWDAYKNQTYTPPSDGWIVYYAISCTQCWVSQDGRFASQMGENAYNERAGYVPVRKGVAVCFGFEARESGGAEVRMSFRPCLQP